MHAADNHNIQILGAIILRFSGKNSNGEEKSTRQIVYVTDRTDKLFLSREGCTDLGIIPDNFPTMGKGDPINTVTISHQEGCETHTSDPVSVATTSHQEECRCPRRTKPPPPPTSMPHSATETNRELLTQYLLDYYRSSTFNVCEHQNLPMMDGPPMRLLIDTQATPTAHHSPIPVPLHWQDEVKADLDRDVRLGVLEPVPIGESVTWCHRMVICAKKNGKPRRTIDFNPSMSTQPEKPTIPNHLTTKQDLSPRGRKNRYSMHGMDITAYHSTQKTDTIQPSSHLGVATDTEQPRKATSHREMATPGDITKSPRLHPITQSVWMTPSCGLIPLKRASFKCATG